MRRTALVEKLREHGIDPKMKKVPGGGGRLAGKTVVVTGELESMTREEAQEAVRREGGKAAGSVSKNTDYLVAGAKPGSMKMRAAEKHGTEILDETAFVRLVGRK